MTKIQLVVFDMAGTTVKDRGEVQACFFQAAASNGLQADGDRINSMMGWSKKQVFQTLWQEQIGRDNPDYQSKVEKSFTKFKYILEEHYRTQSVEPTEGCLELFEWLKSRRIKIALNTGFYRQVADIVLHRLGWDRGLGSDYVGTEESVIQASVTPSEIYNDEGRPAPFMIQKAMYRLGVKDPKTVITIGDTPADIEAGINVGCLFSFGVTNGTHTKAQLAQYPNDGLLSSLLELKDRIVSFENGC
ncbi:HAD hydrolase-like protein [Chroococcidiopsis sp. FACHB-1243]|uniref:HAD family hydrolase n=1 Tax=Chroococcidiopsis sp. [FACHB-1243] TaxID=2692781 RepID=UPI0017850ABF|nr:HAD family hydrolase [Chroococcidiopsis sp. [FACHB-1243]]MBD2304462.1 HAD hydrolase-like protein [Chroococcidiopsis sp. [FACHB-1243]]